MRGDLVTIAMQGDFGKPRPALVVQANQFSVIQSPVFCLKTWAKIPEFRWTSLGISG